jgi:hypothetical protein
MILWEMKQICYTQHIQTSFYRKINESGQYFDMLTTSFGIYGGRYGSRTIHEVQKYLTPASGFQRDTVVSTIW